MHIHLSHNGRTLGVQSLLILASALILHAGEIGVIVPNDLERHGGNAATTVPFDVGDGTARYQQIFDVSQFAPHGPFLGGPGGGMINSIYFRVHGDGLGFNTTLPNIQINLSTTTKAPDSLSPVFAENIGANDTVVRGPGPLALRASGAALLWDIFVPLNTPFFYQPSAGNLLMDIRNFGGGSTTFFDAQISLGDSISSVASYSDYAGGSVDSPTGFTGTPGLVTLFEVTPVPEPGSVSLLLLGLSAFALVRCRAKSADQR